MPVGRLREGKNRAKVTQLCSVSLCYVTNANSHAHWGVCQPHCICRWHPPVALGVPAKCPHTPGPSFHSPPRSSLETEFLQNACLLPRPPPLLSQSEAGPCKLASLPARPLPPQAVARQSGAHHVPRYLRVLTEMQYFHMRLHTALLPPFMPG